MLVLANKTEAQRILHVLDDTLEGLTLLGGLPLGLPHNVKTLQASPQISTLFQKHHQLERKLVKALSSSSRSSSSPPLPTPLPSSSSSNSDVPTLHTKARASSPVTNPFASSEDKVRHLYQTMTRNLVRALRRSECLNDSPISSSSPSTAAFLDVLHELKNLLSQRFSTTLQEDLRRANMLGKLTDKEKYALDSLASLQRTSATKQRDHAKEAAALQTLRHKLETEVTVWAAQTQEDEEMVAQELKATLERATQQHEETISTLTQSIEASVPELTRQAEAHTQAEDKAKDEQQRLEGDLAALIQHYESTLQQIQEDLERLQTLARAEDHELYELRGHFAVVEREEAELQAMEQARQQGVLEGQRMHHAAVCAIRIQSMFRGHKALIAYKALQLASKEEKEKKGDKNTGKKWKKGEKAKPGAGKKKEAPKAGAAAKGGADKKKPAAAAAAAGAAKKAAAGKKK